MTKRIEGKGLAALFGEQHKAPAEKATGKTIQGELPHAVELLSIYTGLTPDNREKLLETARDILHRQSDL